MRAYAEERSDISFGVSPSSGGKSQGLEDRHVDVVFHGSAESLEKGNACAEGEILGTVAESGADMVVEPEPHSEKVSESHPTMSKMSVGGSAEFIGASVVIGVMVDVED